MPRTWKTITAVDRTPISDSMYVTINLVKRELGCVKSKDIYGAFVRRIEVAVTSQAYYNLRFNVQDWTEVYNRIFSTTIESKLRSFQFKFVHNIIYTNDRLFKYGIVQSKYCTFCLTEVESVEHLFCDCIEVQTLWKYIIEVYLQQFGIHQLSNKEILLGFTKGPDIDCFANHVVLLAKWHIHKSRILEVKPTLGDYKALLHNTMSTEARIAQKRNKENVCRRKWQFCE